MATAKRQIGLSLLVVLAACVQRMSAPPPPLERPPERRVVLRERHSRGALSQAEPREPWLLYTVDGLFDAVEQGARRSDVIQVAYDPQYDYPARISGDEKIGLPDNWFWVKASRLTPSR